MSKLNIPLSSSQMNIWNLERVMPGIPVNNICGVLTIEGVFDSNVLNECIYETFDQFRVLRTRIKLVDGLPEQYISDTVSESVHFFDFSETDEEGFEAWTNAMAKQYMQVEDSPLCEISIFKLSENKGGILLRMHHMISDAWSCVITVNHLTSLYLAAIDGKEAVTGEYFEYEEHVANEQKYLTSKAHGRDVKYWTKMLHQIQPAAEKEKKFAYVSPVGNRKTYAVPEQLNRLITRYCETHQVSPFAVMYMTLAVYFGRFRGAKRFSIGVPTINRSSYKEKNTNGMFVNTLPFINEIDLNDSWNESNEKLSEAWMALLTHQRMPYEEIKRIAAANGGSMSDHLFDIVLSYQNGSLRHDQGAKAEIQGTWLYSGYQNESLCIHLSNRDDDTKYLIDYDYLIQIYSEEEIEAMHEMLMRILKAGLTTPDQPIYALPVLGEEMEEKVIFGFNTTDVWYDREQSLSEKLLQVEEAYGNRVALIFHGERIHYRDLFRSGKQIAAALIGQFGTKNDTVAICMKRGPELFEAICGVIFAGKCWMLIDPELPEERIQKMLKDSGATICLRDDHEYRCDDIEGFQPISAVREDSAYLIYTSGSTGTPKAVEVMYGSLLNLTHAMEELYPEGGVLSICNVGFDAFLLESVSAMANACTIVLADEEEMNDPYALAKMIVRYKVGFISATPSRIRLYMKEMEFKHALKKIETLICGGESFPQELYHMIREYSNTDIWNQYGPSEATVVVSQDLLAAKGNASIGKPLPNCRLYVLDEHQRPLPINAVGEIYIGGECLAKGYRNREELIAKTFIEAPFLNGERLYRTGDYGKWTSDGRILFMGRRDNQVKILGHRIELSEIESVLLRYPGVKSTAVTVSGNYLIAYYIAEEMLSAEDMNNFLAEYLPRYYLPSYYIHQEEFPITRNGKVDFEQMPKPDQRHATNLPTNETEAVIAQVWSDILGYQVQNIDSDYFLIGGDSLNATLMLLKLEQKLDVKVSLKKLQSHGTIRKLAKLIAQHENQGNKKIKKAEEQSWYPLPKAQTAFYVMHQLDETGITYNIPAILRVEGSLDEERLNQAFQQLVADDSVFRTTFEIRGQELVGVIHDHMEVTLERMKGESFIQAAKAFIRPFDLARGPLIRLAVLELADGEKGVLLDMHHVISDGVSNGVILRRLRDYYEGSEVTVDLQYVDYAWGHLDSAEILKEQKDFWKHQIPDNIGEVVEADLTFDHKRPTNFDSTGAQVFFEMGADLSEKIKERCAEWHVTPYAFLLAIYSIFVGTYTRKDQMVLGSPFSGRTMPGTVDMTGVFVKTLPIFLKFDRTHSLKQYVQAVGEQITDIIEHQELTLEEIGEIAGVSKSREKNLLFTKLFTMIPYREENVVLGGATLSEVKARSESVKVDLNLEISETELGYHCMLEYAKSLFDECTIEYYGRCYLAALHHALEEEELTVGGLRMIDVEDERRLLTAPWEERYDYSKATLDEQLVTTVQREGDRVAVTFGDGESLSFNEFRKEADQITGALWAKGVRETDKVAFLMKRTGHMLAAMFGILGAGAAYVPISPEFPEDRISYMIEKADVKLIICDELPELPPEVVRKCVRLQELMESEPGEPIRFDADRSSRPANVIFTSGTTGKPKGVMMNHRALSNLLENLEPMMGDKEERILCASNCVFAVFTTETVLALAAGYSVSVADEEEMMLPRKMAERIRRDQATILQLTPSRIQMCLGDKEFRTTLKQIRRIILLGEPWTMKLRAEINRLTDAYIFNIYGPTETSVYNCLGDVTHSGGIHIGTPLKNCRYYLLNDKRQLLNPTCIGEIYIAGDCLSDGYINARELTDKVFVPDICNPGELMYKTGDLGRLRADGNWQCIGRVDTQVKLNGHRIELEEIASVILESGMVKEAAVVLMNPNEQSAYLRAVSVANETYEEEALRSFIRKKLPDYMMPSEYLTTDHMPKNANGKTDAHKLRALMAAPQEAVEQETSALGEIWRAVLGRTPDREVSFFDQGGTSLQAIIALNQYYEMGFECTINDFYHHPMLGDQEKLWESMKRGQKLKNKPKEDILSETYRTEAKPCVSGPVFMTGATGYLGSHILEQVLLRSTDEVYCLVRGGEKERLLSVLRLYVDPAWVQTVEQRVHVVDGDLLKPEFGMEEEQYQLLAERIEKVFHCAADVRHYALEEELYQANVVGTEHVIAFAKDAHASLHHCSTVSVAGEALDTTNEVLTEGRLYIGQNWWDNPYIKTKTLAEQAIYKAAKDGLATSVYRVGRLVNDSRSGVFQKNPESNAFYRFVRGIVEVGVLAESLSGAMMEVTPIDQAADAIVTLSEETGGTWHIYSPYERNLGEMTSYIGHVSKISDEEFEQILSKISKEDSEYIQAVKHQWSEQRVGAKEVGITETESLKKLEQKGFRWSPIDYPQLCDIYVKILK